MNDADETALPSSESERLRRLYETVLSSTPDFVYVFSLDHRVLYANDALIKMWGRGLDGTIGKTFLEIGYEPWHAQMHEREIDQVRATRQPVRGEVPFTGTLGRRHYEYIFVPVIGADGEVEAVAGTTRDVTERHLAQERQDFLYQLADTLRLLSDPVEVQSQASRVLGEYLGANRVVYFEILGDEYVIERDYTAGVKPLAGRYPVSAFGPALLIELLSGRTVVESDATKHPGRSPAEQAAFAGIQVRGHVDVPLVKGGKFVGGMTVHRIDAHEWSLSEVALIKDTAERTWATVQQARAEAELRASEERRRLALDAAELGSWHMDLSTNKFSTDERFRLIYAGSTAPMDYERAIACIHPDDRGRVQHAIALATSAEDPVAYALEYRLVHPDGTARWVLAKGRVSYGPGTPQRPSTFDGTVADITARKLIEEKQELLVAQLREQDRRKDVFLATLAHELRNPLAPIRNGLHVMKLAGASGKVEAARSMMDRQLTQLVRLVDDLLDVSRVTSGKLELRKERVALESVVESAIETTRPVIDQAGHRLSIELPDQPVVLMADPTRLAQVVSNLLNNAAKYTPSGGRIRLTAQCEDGTVVLSVADDGIGIPPAMLNEVFEVFTQVDRTLEKTTGGLGIGLSLVKGLVELHGGTVEARSAGESLGAEFVIRLPTLPADLPAIAARPDNALADAPRYRILVADDNADSADSLSLILEMLGHEVVTANDGEEAVEVAQREQPDLILLDIAMPKLNGYDACRRIRQQPWASKVCLAAMTGWGQDEDKSRSEHAGFDVHLVKPVDPQALNLLLSSLGRKPPAETSASISLH